MCLICERIKMIKKRNKSLFCPGAENRPAPEELTELKSRLAEELEKLI